MSILSDIEGDVARAAIRAALGDFLKGEVAKHMISQAQADYITEGATDAVTLALNEIDAPKGVVLNVDTDK